MSNYSGSRTQHQVARSVVAIAVALIFVTVVLWSPFIMAWLGRTRKADWPRIAAVGQVYAGVSALFAVLGLSVVAASLTVHAREGRALREQIFRGQHHDLIKLSIQNHRLRQSWGGATFASGRQADDRMEQLGFANMIVSFWLSNHRLGTLHDREIRSNFRNFFAGEIGRQHWHDAREGYRHAATDRRGRRFWTIADDEYQQATNAGPPTVPAHVHTQGRRDRLPWLVRS
ncbi:MAG: DUF6082 family protein [Mycobacteriales bacterium]